MSSRSCSSSAPAECCGSKDTLASVRWGTVYLPKSARVDALNCGFVQDLAACVRGVRPSFSCTASMRLETHGKMSSHFLVAITRFTHRPRWGTVADLLYTDDQPRFSTLSTGPNATWMNRVYNGLISSATPWVVLWPSNWHGVGERPPCARFRLAASGHLVTDCGNGRWQRLQTAPGWLVSCGPSHRFH